jgi:hypothetical protein
MQGSPLHQMNKEKKKTAPPRSYSTFCEKMLLGPCDHVKRSQFMECPRIVK